MNPNGETNQGSFERAAPAPSEQGELGADTTVESRPAGSPENSPQNLTSQANAQVASALSLSNHPAVVTVSDDDTHTLLPTATQPAVEDKNLEKQSVEKAKAIIATTKDDPYEQKKKLGQFKAEYIAERYKTTIKTDDAVAT